MNTDVVTHVDEQNYMQQWNRGPSNASFLYEIVDIYLWSNTNIVFLSVAILVSTLLTTGFVGTAILDALILMLSSINFKTKRCNHTISFMNKHPS